jgi:large subunit ribosomal protein L10
MRLVQRQRKIPEDKKLKYERIRQAFQKYNTVVIADIEGLDSNVIKKIKFILKSMFGDQIEFASLKLSITRKALKELSIPSLEALEKYLTGQRMFIFSNLNPFVLYSLISVIKIPAPAQPGMVVDKEIVIPAGNTGIPPGPMLSVFGRLRIQTKVQGGTIWIAKDAKVAKPGDTISPELASLLQKLGIMPVEKGIKVLAAYHDGIVIPSDKLKLDIDEYASMLTIAHRNAVSVGIEAAIPVPEIMKQTVSLAYLRAVTVASEAGVVLPETAERVLSLAVKRAYAIILALGEKAKELGLEAPVMSAPAAAQPAGAQAEAKPREEEKEEEEKKEISEEDLAAGLGSLFG